MPDYPPSPWWKRSLMEELYIEKEWSIEKIANEFGTDKRRIFDWLDNHGIETRGKSELRGHDVPKLHHLVSVDHPYEAIICDGEWFQHHRLLAIAKYGFDEVCDKHVHHKNNIPWDNRLENIEVLSPSEHVKLHQSDEYDPHSVDSI